MSERRSKIECLNFGLVCVANAMGPAPAGVFRHDDAALKEGREGERSAPPIPIDAPAAPRRARTLDPGLGPPSVPCR